MMKVLNADFLMQLKLYFFSSSEKFMVKLNKNGGPKNPEKVDRLCALFTVGPTTVIATAKKYRTTYENTHLGKKDTN